MSQKERTLVGHGQCVYHSGSSGTSFTSARLDSTFDFGSDDDCDSGGPDCGDVVESYLRQDDAGAEVMNEGESSADFHLMNQAQKERNYGKSEEITTNNVTTTVENVPFGISFLYLFCTFFTECQKEG